jgi:alpha-1,6-mannosyltransferase
VAIAPSRLRPVGDRFARLSTGWLDRLNDWELKLRQKRPLSTILRFAQAPVTRDIEGSRFLVGPAVLGFIATLLIAFGASQPSSPFALKLPGAWFFGIAANGPQSTKGLFLGLVCVYGGIVLLVRVWFGVLRALSHTNGVAIRKLAWLLVIWSIPIVVAAPLFSHDIYSYAAQGEMMSHHISPYQYGPLVLGPASNSFTSLLDHFWMDTPSPYGPFFLGTAGLLTSLSQHNVLADVILLRVLALVGVLLIAVSLPSLTRSLGRDPSLVFAFVLLNPVTILHLIGGAHNDALMVGLLVAGIALARRNRPVLGIVLCALAASVKIPAAIGIIYIGWEWVGVRVPLRERVRPVVTAVLISGTVMGALSLITGLGWGWVANLNAPDAVQSWLSPTTFLGVFFSDVLHLLGLTVAQHSVLSVTRAIGLVAALVAGVVLLLRADRIGTVKAMGLTLLLVVLLSPVLQPWYLSWGLVLLAPVAAGWLRRALIVLSVAAVFVGLPGGQQLVHAFFYSDPFEVAGALLLLLAIFLAPLGPVSLRGETPRREKTVSSQLGPTKLGPTQLGLAQLGSVGGVSAEPAPALALPMLSVSPSTDEVSGGSR